MARIYVISGHGNGDPGACAHGYSEAERVRALAQRIKDFGGDSVMLHPFSDNAYASNAISRLTIPKDYQIVELHMDSAGSGARGGHVVINGRYSADAYDKALANSISSIFPGRSKTMVGRTDLANPNRAAARGYSYRLVENGFISNYEDIQIFNNRLDDIAKAYLDAFGISYRDEEYDAAAEAERIEAERVAGLPDSLKGYRDLWPDQWYTVDVQFVVENKIMSGVSPSEFCPDEGLTRAQAVAVLYKMDGGGDAVPYTDIEKAPWYYDALAWATEKEIAKGYNGVFRPQDTASRGEFITMLWRYAGNPEASGEPAVDDWNEVGEYAKPAVAWACEKGILKTGTVRASETCTRAMTAAIIHRLKTDE